MGVGELTSEETWVQPNQEGVALRRGRRSLKKDDASRQHLFTGRGPQRPMVAQQKTLRL